MKYYGFTLGWISGMILQVIFFPMLIHKNPLTNHAWWVVQLTGFFISILVWFYLDRKVIIAYFKSIDWNVKWEAIIKWWQS